MNVRNPPLFNMIQFRLHWSFSAGSDVQVVNLFCAKFTFYSHPCKLLTRSTIEMRVVFKELFSFVSAFTL